MARKLTGFLPYGQDDDDVVVRDPLTGPPVSGVTLRGSRTLDPVRGSIFDNGGDGFAGIGIDWATLGLTASDIVNGCSWSVEVESAWFAKTGVDEALFTSYTSSTTRIAGPRLQSGSSLRDWILRAAKYTSRFVPHALSWQDRDYVTVYCSIQFGGTLETYVDGERVSVTELAAGSDANITSALFNNFHVGNGHGSSTTAPVTHYMRNFQFIKRPLALTTHPKCRNVHAYGDSFLDRGGYPAANWPVLYTKPDYPDTSGASATNVTNSDADFLNFAALPTIQRHLAKQNIFIGKQWQPKTAVSGALLDSAARCIQNYAIGGSAVDSGATFNLPQQIDRALNRGDVPDLVVMHMGQNDITSTVTLDAAWRTQYTDQIDRILARNPNARIVVCNMTSLRNDPTYQTEAYDTRTADCNARIAEIAAAYDEVYLCDLFTGFGGHSFDSALFDPADRHPSDLGSKLLGELVGEVFLEIIGT